LSVERLIRIITLALLYVAAASIVLMLFLAWPGVYGGPANLVDMVNNVADTPYAYRLLLPQIVRFSSAALDRMWAAERVEGGRRAVEGIGAFVLRHTHAPPDALEHAHLYGVYSLGAFLCFAGFALLLRASIRALYPRQPPWVSDFTPIAALVVLPFLFFRYVSFVYDPMTLVVFGLGLYLITKRLLLPYLLFFPLAVLGKETAILLLLLLLVRGAWGWSRRGTVGVILYHVAVFAILKALLAYAFRGTGGGFVKFQAAVSLGYLTDPRTWEYFITRTLLPVLPVAVLVVDRWGEKPAFLRRGLLALGIPMFVGCTLFGGIGELRTYYELYPVAVLLAVPTVARAFRWRAADAPTLAA
jgi:hypothetical protein